MTKNSFDAAFPHKKPRKVQNKHKLHYDVQTRQVKIAGIEGDQIVAIKEQVLPALASTVITARYKGKPEPNVNYFLTEKSNAFWNAGCSLY